MSTAHNPKPRPEVEMQPVNIPGTVAYFEIDDGSLMGAGILKGDKAVVLLDCEVQRDDLVLVHVVGEGLRVLRYHTAPGGRVKPARWSSPARASASTSATPPWSWGASCKSSTARARSPKRSSR